MSSLAQGVRTVSLSKYGPFRLSLYRPKHREQSIDSYPDAMSVDALRERAWPLVPPHDIDCLASVVEAFGAVVDHVPDDFGGYAVPSGGDVIIVRAKEMPGRTGAAAIYRF